MMTRWAVLDRDGTIIVDRGYLADPEGVAFAPGAVAGLRALRAAGFGLVVATNQSGVGRGMFGMDAVAAVNARLAAMLAHEGLALEGMFVCPHGPDDVCLCRKPLPGMLQAAARAHRFAPADAVMIGDGERDVAAGHAAGMAAIRIAPAGTVSAAPVVADLAEAAALAIAHFAREGAR